MATPRRDRGRVPCRALLALGVLVGGCEPPAADELTAPIADHHLHVMSEDALSVLQEIQDAVGQQVVEDDESPVTAERAVAALDSAGIPQGAILSVAYFFGFRGIDVPDEEARVRAENDWVSSQVGRFPERLVGFCSFSPFAPYAISEAERCARLPGIVGLKLHFANSDVDLRDPDHLARLGELFERGNELGLAFVVHMRTRNPDYGTLDVQAFASEVLARAPDVPIQIAHLAGWGGFDEATADAFEAFALLLAQPGVDPGGRIFFDLAAVLIEPSRAEGDTALLRQIETMNQGVRDAIRTLGTDRIVFGSDWTAVSVRGGVEVLRSALGLEAAEVQEIFARRGGYLP
jgi:uncharacterized protein